MSLWKIGAQDITEEAQAIKDQLSSKESHIAAQETKLLRQAEQLDELKAALNDALQKLSHETARAMKLENDLTQTYEDLRNEKLTSHNIEAALAATQDKINTKELETRELEAIIDTLSQKSDGANTRNYKLEREKNILEARVKELEANLENAVVTPRTVHQPRRRSSSMSQFRVTTLEQQLQEASTSLAQKQMDLQMVTAKLAQVQEELRRSYNERIAIEKRLGGQIKATEASLQEKSEELEYLRLQVGNGTREEELMRRIEEDDAKITALEGLLRNSSGAEELKAKLVKAEQRLQTLASENEARHIELVVEKEAALDELENARADIIRLLHAVEEKDAALLGMDKKQQDLVAQVNSTKAGIDDSTAEHCERLLSAVNRLRQERDGLRRQIQFLETESKFTIESLEAKLEQLSSARDQLMEVDQTGITTRRKPQSLDVTATALAISVVHLQTALDSTNQDHHDIASKYNEVRAQFGAKECKLRDTEVRLEQTAAERDQLLAQLEAQVAEWKVKLEQAQAEHIETSAQLSLVGARLDDVVESMEAVESERDSLRLQVTHLTNDLSAAQADLAEAESRYTTLQMHQLASMSSNEVTRTLRKQIEELEARVLRRTEQIGIHQHDIKRLETNLKLQEERLLEMTMEMETLAAQKEAMVEDCADAREARDHALQQVEQLEIEVEELEVRTEQADQSIATMVGVIFDTVSRSRGAIREHKKRAVTAHNRETQALQDQSNLRNQIMDLQSTVEDLQQKLADTAPMGRLVDSAINDLRACCVALAVSRAAASCSAKIVQELRDTCIQLRRQVSTLQGKVDTENATNRSLSEQLVSLQERADGSTAAAGGQIAELEAQVQDLQTAISGHQNTLEELRHSNDELQRQLDEARRPDGDVVMAEVSKLQSQHRDNLVVLEAELAEAKAAANELRQLQDTAERCHQEALSAAAQEKILLEERLHSQSQHLEQDQQQCKELLKLRNDQTSEIDRLQGLLNSTSTQLERQHQELRQLRQQHEQDSAQSRKEWNDRLAEVTTSSLASKVALEEQLEEKVQELQAQIQENQGIAAKLQAEVESRQHDRLAHDQALRAINDRYQQAETAQAQLQRQLHGVQAEFQQTMKELETLRGEKNSLQAEITSLEAEIQRSISLRRFLEAEAKESEHTISSLKTTIEHVRADLARTEKLAQAAEMNLSLQSVQHKRETSDLHRELGVLKSRPNLDAVVAELEERNTEMEELLRAKCVEIEENDDKVLDMLKENRKLSTKVESLTRKVQNLQTKLAAAKASGSKPEAVADAGTSPPAFSNVGPSEFGRLAASSSFVISAVPAPSHKPSPPLMRAPPSRVVSGPSSLPRPKTPDYKVPPLPVFKAHTPEPPVIPISTSDLSPTAGKKRRAPDDFDQGENLPPQGFTVDSLPGDDTENRTPRVRRVLQSIHSGFTPVRHANRPAIPPSSSKRSVTSSFSEAHSPRGGKSKRSWLGKIRGVSSQVSSGRTAPSRPVFEAVDR